MFTFVSAPLDAPVRTAPEFGDYGRDPHSGARIMRMTNSSLPSTMIYCEVPCTASDGKRFAIARTQDHLFGSYMLIIGDLAGHALALVEPAIPHYREVVPQAWGEWLYYRTHEGGVRRASMLTFAREEVLPAGTLAPGAAFHTMTPDGRCLIFMEDARDGEPMRMLRHDTATGEWRVLRESAGFLGHELIDPAAGEEILFYDHHDDAVEMIVLDLDGTNPRPLPFGGAFSAESSGHHAWVTGADRIATAVEWNRGEKRHDPRHPEGNLLIARPGDTRPTVFPAPEHGFYHVSVSRCGTYFVCDDYMDAELNGPGAMRIGPVRVVVGNLQTGRHRILVSDCQTNGASAWSWSEPTPCFTADTRHVLYDGSPFGINQVFAAEVTPEFLGSLA